MQSNLQFTVQAVQKTYSMVTAEIGTSKGVIGSDTLYTLKYSALKKFDNPAWKSRQVQQHSSYNDIHSNGI